jgi:hypothetical protein
MLAAPVEHFGRKAFVPLGVNSLAPHSRCPYLDLKTVGRRLEASYNQLLNTTGTAYRLGLFQFACPSSIRFFDGDTMIDRKMKKKKQLLFLFVYSSIHYIPTACHAIRNVLLLQESPRQRPFVKKSVSGSVCVSADGARWPGGMDVEVEVYLFICRRICTSHFRTMADM